MLEGDERKVVDQVGGKQVADGVVVGVGGLVLHQGPEHVGVVEMHRAVAGRKDRKPEHIKDGGEQAEQEDAVQACRLLRLDGSGPVGSGFRERGVGYPRMSRAGQKAHPCGSGLRAK